MHAGFKSAIYLPLAFSLFIGGGILICYGIGRSTGRYPKWPYVSDAGTGGPEACLFALFLALGAAAGFATMHCYYKYVIACSGQSKLNKAAWWAGLIACFGMLCTGAFQWDLLLVPHLIGAGLVQVGAVTYCWLLVAISWRQMVPQRVHGKTLVYVRAIFTLLATVTFVCFSVGLFLDMQVDQKHSTWATVLEWVGIYLIIIVITTLAYDLRNVVGFKTEVIRREVVASPTQFDVVG